jgi:hypothetical protein
MPKIPDEFKRYKFTKEQVYAICLFIDLLNVFGAIPEDMYKTIHFMMVKKGMAITEVEMIEVQEALIEAGVLEQAKGSTLLINRFSN